MVPRGAPAEPGRTKIDGLPVGRRLVLGLAGLGVAGVLGGGAFSNLLAKWLGPIEMHDPTGLLSLLPLGDTFRYYSVTGSVPTVTESAYRLTISGEVENPTSYAFADLQRMQQTDLVQDFQCVTGWRVLDVPWSGVPLSTLITTARPKSTAGSVLFRSFDGTYTESLTMAEAMRPGVIVALRMLGGPVTHDHGGPVRMYCASMYGYKSTKWLTAIELTTTEIPGYWETRGYDINGEIAD